MLLSLNAHAAIEGGGQEGNGGDVLDCPGKAPELLDFYDGRTFKGLENVFPSRANYRDIVSELIEFYRPQYPGMAATLESDFAEFNEQNVQFVRGIELVDINDSKHIGFPPDCRIRQIAVQRKPKYREDKRYTINEDLWDLIDPINKAGLVVHELLYRRGIDGGVRNSIDVRYLNALLFSKKFSLKTDEERYQTLLNVRYSVIDFASDVSRLVSPVYKNASDCDETGSNCRPAIEPMYADFDSAGRLVRFNARLAGEVGPVASLVFPNGLSLFFRSNPEWSYDQEFTLNVDPVSGKSFFQAIPDGHLEGRVGDQNFSVLFNSLGAEGFCVRDGRYQNEIFSINRPGLDLYSVAYDPAKPSCRYSPELVAKLVTGPITLSFLVSNGFIGVKNYPLPTDQDLQAFLESTEGRWVMPAGHGNTVFAWGKIQADVPLEWHRPGGKLLFKENSPISVDAQGNLEGANNRYLEWRGVWETPLGFDFDASGPKDKLSLRKDYSFAKGYSETVKNYRNEFLELNFRQLEVFSERYQFSYIPEGNSVKVQGRELQVGRELFGWLEVSREGGWVKLLNLCKSVKLTMANGKEKLIKASETRPVHVWFNSAGLVVETKPIDDAG